MQVNYILNSLYVVYVKIKKYRCTMICTLGIYILGGD